MAQELIKPKSFKDVVQTDAIKSRLKEIMGERSQQFAVALTQIVNGSYQLQKCEPNSILGAALTAASLDLSCDPNLGEAHLVPYGDKCQFQIGYRGFIQLAMRSGQYKAIGSSVVYEGELVDYDRLTGELTLDRAKKESDLVVGYAAKFKLINGFERAEFWTAEEIEAHATRYSKAYKYAKGNPSKEANCLWVTDRDKMALKTVEKALLAHYGPKSIQMQKALKLDGGAVIDADSEVVEYVDNESATQVAKPVFEKPVEAIQPEPESEPAPEPEPVKKPVSRIYKPSGDGSFNKRKAVLGMIANNGITEAEMLKAVHEMSGFEVGKTLAETGDEVVNLIYGSISELISDIQSKKA